MKGKGIDSAESWAIAGASIIINFLILAPARLSGVLFVAFMERFNIDREKASLPFTLCYILRTLPGPLAGFLGETFGLRLMSIIGCVLATVGVGACFLAEDIFTVTILLGGCYGLGYGFVCSLIPEFLNQYFDKHLAKANGLTMGGAGLGAFLLPPVVEILIRVYGVSGMMLIFGGLVLHSVPATMLLRKANFQKTPKTLTIVENSIEDGTCPKKPEQCEQSSSIFTVTSSVEKIISEPEPVSMTPCGNRKISNLINNCNVSLTSEQTNHSPCKDSSFKTENVNRDISNNRAPSYKSETPLLLSMRNLRNSVDIKDFHFKKFSDKEMHEKLFHPDVEISGSNKQRNSACRSFRVFTDPAFIFIAVTQSTYFFIMFLIWTIIVDFVRDKGIPPEQEVYFVMCLSLSDTLGRLCLGWITDNRLLTKSNYSALCFLAMGIFCFILPSTKGFSMILTFVFLYGFISGGVMIIFPGMVTQFIDKDLRTMAMASRTSLNAPMSMTISPLIGYFRCNLGSYDWILYIMMISSLVCCFTSWFTPTMARIRDRRLNK